MRTSLRTRLTFSMIAVVVGALSLAGLGAILLQGRSTLAQQKSQLVSQARTIASNLADLRSANALRAVSKIAGFTGVALVPFDSSGTIVTGQSVGNNRLSLPPNLSSNLFPSAKILAGEPIEGRSGKTLFAAMPTKDSSLFTTCASGYVYQSRFDVCIKAGSTFEQLRRAVRSRKSSSPPLIEIPGNACTGVSCAGVLVLLTRTLTLSKAILGYFLVASGIALALAVAVALSIAQRITRPLRRAVESTRKIASGDLDAELPSHDGDYPELASLIDSLNAMSSDLRKARDLQRDFLLSVSHDLRTPLTSIRGYAEAISDSTVDDPVRAADVIATESRRLERLVADLLDLAKLSAHVFSLELRKVDVREVVATTADAFRPMLGGEGIELTVTITGEGPVEVAADSDRLRQVLSNLLENAYKYANSSVRVLAGIREGWVVIAVEDDGPGIPSDDLPHVFERLYSAQRVAARRAGTGLGLAIVSELVGAMGATVRADSPVGEKGGTRIVITFRPWGQDGEGARVMRAWRGEPEAPSAAPSSPEPEPSTSPAPVPHP